MNTLQNSINRIMNNGAMRGAVIRLGGGNQKSAPAVEVETKEQYIKVFVGVQRGKDIFIRAINYFKDKDRMDDVFSTVIMRGRDKAKGLLVEPQSEEHNTQLTEAMTLDGVFDYSWTLLQRIDILSAFTRMPPRSITFYLDDKTKWQALSNVDEYVYNKPTPVIDIYKAYYTNYYPKAVLEKAALNSNEPLRVYDYYEDEEGEHYLMEPLFVESDIVEHIIVPIDADSHGPQGASPS